MEQREVKFIGWQINMGCFTPPFTIKQIATDFVGEGRDIEWLEYTGQSDKHKRDIYEGFYVSDGETVFCVEYNRNQSGFWIMPVKSLTGENDFIHFFGAQNLGNGYFSRMDLEIVGNIFQDPNLEGIKIEGKDIPTESPVREQEKRMLRMNGYILEDSFSGTPYMDEVRKTEQDIREKHARSARKQLERKNTTYYEIKRQESLLDSLTEAVRMLADLYTDAEMKIYLDNAAQEDLYREVGQGGIVSIDYNWRNGGFSLFNSIGIMGHKIPVYLPIESAGECNGVECGKWTHYTGHNQNVMFFEVYAFVEIKD